MVVTLPKEGIAADQLRENGEVRLHDLPNVEHLNQPSLNLNSTSFNWEAWARRSEESFGRAGKALETAVWGAIGAMLGTFLGGLPGTMIPGWAFFVWQPLGAACGGLLALILIKRGQKPFKPIHRTKGHR